MRCGITYEVPFQRSTYAVIAWHLNDLLRTVYFSSKFGSQWSRC